MSTQLNLTSSFKARPTQAPLHLDINVTTPCYENGRLVGYWGATWNRDGKIVRVFIPSK
jgi:hypothetical protein